MMLVKGGMRLHKHSIYHNAVAADLLICDLHNAFCHYEPNQRSLQQQTIGTADDSCRVFLSMFALVQ